MDRLAPIVLLLVAHVAILAAVEVPRWTIHEIELTAAKDYANPFADVGVTATFTCGGATVVRPGFWDGGRTWRVRFAPPAEGEWTWTTTCTVADDTGLHGREGALTCVTYEGDNPNYQHGPIRVSDNRRYFVRADGTPFFWLGDTRWQMADWEHLADNNAPDAQGRSQYVQLNDDRQAKGFTVIQNYFNGHGTHWWRDEGFACIDPARFREVLDPMLDDVARRGMVIAQGIGLYHTSLKLPRVSLVRLAEYVAARYGAHPLVWFTAQEVNLPTRKGQDPRTDLEAWKAAAKAFAEANGTGVPVGGHMFPGTPTVWGQEPWHDWFPLQGGHTNCGPRTRKDYRFYWDHQPTKPYLETEAMYEQIRCGPRMADETDVRQVAWKALLSGSYGFTYGGAAVWLFKWSKEDPRGEKYNPGTWWYEGMNLPGSGQMKHLKDFFADLEWWTLEPRFAAPEWCELPDRECTVVAGTPDGTTVVYAYGKQPVLGRLKGLPAAAAFSAWWFCPRTGRRYLVMPSFCSDDGTWTMPDRPTAEDWVLLVRRGAAKEPEREGNLARFAIPSADRTDTRNGYRPAQAVDGTADHGWNGWSAPAGSILTLTWPRPVAVGKVVLHTKEGHALADYRIEVRVAGEWSAVAEVSGNEAVRCEHVFEPATVDALRIVASKGPPEQAAIVRVNEVEVFGK